MNSFKSLYEALLPSQYRKYMKIGKEVNHKERYKDIFGDKDRIILDINEEDNNYRIVPPQEIIKELDSKGLELVDYKKGMAKDKYGRLTKIGKYLSKNNLIQYQNDPRRASGGKYKIVISKHPYDIAGMSTDRGWTSCMDLDDKKGKEEIKNNKHIVDDIKEGTLIAYMVSDNDVDIKRPISRVLIKPLKNNKKEVLFALEGAVYGMPTFGFLKTLNRWVIEKNKNKFGKFKFPKKLYNDDLPDETFVVNNNDKKSIKAFLDDNKIKNYNINDDFTVDVNGDVDLSYTLRNQFIDKIPIKFGKVTGDFLCNNNSLMTLTNCPDYVGENFDCSKNSFSTLIGGPKYVGKDYIARDNERLSNLIGAPKLIDNGSFVCDHSGLRTLEGAPVYIKRNFNCSNNRLSSLINGPEKVENDFICKHNRLTSLAYCPKYIGNDFIFNGNLIQNVDFAPEYLGNEFDGGTLISRANYDKFISNKLSVPETKEQPIQQTQPVIKKPNLPSVIKKSIQQDKKEPNFIYKLSVPEIVNYYMKNKDSALKDITAYMRSVNREDKMNLIKAKEEIAKRIRG